MGAPAVRVPRPRKLSRSTTASTAPRARSTLLSSSSPARDAHGKHIALLHPSVVTLAPLFDTVPTALWSTLRDDAAMSIKGRFRLTDLTRSDLVEEAHR